MAWVKCGNQYINTEHFTNVRVDANGLTCYHVNGSVVISDPCRDLVEVLETLCCKRNYLSDEEIEQFRNSVGEIEDLRAQVEFWKAGCAKMREKLGINQ